MAKSADRVTPERIPIGRNRDALWILVLAHISWRISCSENRRPSRIKSGTGFSGICANRIDPATARALPSGELTETKHNGERNARDAAIVCWRYHWARND